MESAWKSSGRLFSGDAGPELPSGLQREHNGLAVAASFEVPIVKGPSYTPERPADNGERFYVEYSTPSSRRSAAGLGRGSVLGGGHCHSGTLV